MNNKINEIMQKYNKLNITQEMLESWYSEASNLLVAGGLNPLPEIPVFAMIGLRRNILGTCFYTQTSEGKTCPSRIEIYKDKASSLESAKETLLHEAAHAYCVYYYNESGHTPLFARIAKALGSTGSAYQQSSDKIKKASENRANAISSFVNHTELTKRDIHSMRCSFKMIANKYDLPLTAETFDTYIRPRYKYIFTSEQITEALAVILRN